VNPELPRPRFLTPPEAATWCGVTRNTVFNWVRQGKLKAYQTPGKTNLIRPSDLVSFMEASGMFVPKELFDLAREDTAVQAAQTHAEPPGADAQPKVLIVDDDAAVRNVTNRALQGIAPIYEAETGFEALHLLTLHKDIRVVLLDLHMPGQHGLKTLREIKSLYPSVQVVIVTAYAGEIMPEMSADGTIAKILLKPFRIEEIQRIVQDLLTKSSQPG